MQVILEVTTGSQAGQRLALEPGQLREIGRGDACALCLASDLRLSGAHFAIDFTGLQCLLRDLRSTNGTFIHGERVAQAVLADGDEISAGQTKFVVRIERGPDRPAASGIGVSNYAVAVDAKPAPSGGGLVDDDFPDVGEPLGRELLSLTNDTRFVAGTVLTESAPNDALLTIVIKATFAFDAKGNVDLAARQLPLFAADVLENPKDPTSPVRFESDLVPFKPRGDVVLVGRACGPRRPRVQQLDVRVRVGALDKTVRIFGDRRWIFPSWVAMAPRMSEPEPFQEMELTYRRSFGGIDAASALYCAENLAGAGFIGKPSPESMDGRPLPNLEDLDALVTTWDSHPQPTGFGFYGRGWAPRLRLAGTYDAAYLASRHPLPPADFSYDFYNGAHPQLQVPGYLHGGETVDLYNLHPDGPLHFSLPRVRPLVTIARYATGIEGSRGPLGGDIRVGQPLMPPFDTLVLIPERRMFYEVFRCPIPLAGLDALDVHNVTITQLER